MIFEACQTLNIREKLNGGEAQSMPEMDGGCAVSNATKEGFMRGRAMRRSICVWSNAFVGLKRILCWQRNVKINMCNLI